MSVQPVAGYIREMRLISGFSFYVSDLRVLNQPDHRGGDIPVSVLPVNVDTLHGLLQQAAPSVAVSGWTEMPQEERDAVLAQLAESLVTRLAPRPR